MCTAISFISGHHYFGRNLDLEYHYSESVTITPRNFPLYYRQLNPLYSHHSIIGIATVIDNYPLYYDATNEHGLSMAALNFPGNAIYNKPDINKINLGAFELIPYILGNFETVAQIVSALNQINIIDISFNEDLPVTPLHWLIADRKQTITVEQTAEGLHIYDNPIRVLTNNPPFPYHLQNICNYLNITAEEPNNRFAENLSITPYSRGMGGIGLPGDLSSQSRFIRAAFTLHNAAIEESETNSISQFFHILGSVEQQKGCVRIGDKLEETVYTSCCDTDRCVYYYTTYHNRQITAVDMQKFDLAASELIFFPLRYEQQIFWEESKTGME